MFMKGLRRTRKLTFTSEEIMSIRRQADKNNVKIEDWLYYAIMMKLGEEEAKEPEIEIESN